MWPKAGLYWDNKLAFFDARNVTIPVAVRIFPDDIYAAPRSWTEQAYPKRIHYSRLEKGGQSEKLRVQRKGGDAGRAEDAMAKQIGATTTHADSSHVAMLSHPKARRARP